MTRCGGPRTVRRLVASVALALSLSLGSAAWSAPAPAVPATPSSPGGLSGPGVSQAPPSRAQPPTGHAAAPPAESVRPAAQAGGLDPQRRATLAQYGRFAHYSRYGEVWIPTATPPGWHPYPACHWVKTTRFGWSFDDATPWGAIVHHYGRWMHDEHMGWVWVPGAEYSPGWVVWRAGEQWIGWAPMPPDQDAQALSAAQLDAAIVWTFLDPAAFARGCEAAAVVPAARIPALLKETNYVRDIAFTEGMAVFVLPTEMPGAPGDVDIDVPAWTPAFLADVLIRWNAIWNGGAIVANVTTHDCAPAPPPKPPALAPPSLCPPGTFPEPSGECAIYAPPVCPAATFLDASGMCAPIGQTQCPQGSFAGPTGQCALIPPPACPEGTVFGRDLRCVRSCGVGAHQAGGRCVADDAACPGGAQRLPGGQCPPPLVCASGTHAGQGRCIADEASCPGGARRLASGQCPPAPLVCASGTHEVRGKCVADATAPPKNPCAGLTGSALLLCEHPPLPAAAAPPMASPPAPPSPAVVAPQPVPRPVVAPPPRPRFVAPLARPHVPPPRAAWRAGRRPAYVPAHRTFVPHVVRPRPPVRGCGPRGRSQCRR